MTLKFFIDLNRRENLVKLFLTVTDLVILNGLIDINIQLIFK